MATVYLGWSYDWATGQYRSPCGRYHMVRQRPKVWLLKSGAKLLAKVRNRREAIDEANRHRDDKRARGSLCSWTDCTTPRQAGRSQCPLHVLEVERQRKRRRRAKIAERASRRGTR